MDQEIRTFIAIELSDEIRQKIKEIQSEIRPLIQSRISWSKPENIHLTLKFLGDVSLDKIESIKESLKKIGRIHSPLEMSFGGIGTFPNFRRPRVIWLGIDRGAEQVIKIVSSIEMAMKKLGFQPERREFTPHLTLGRIKQRGVNLEKIKPELKKYDKPNIPIVQVDRLALIKSELYPSGAIYTALEQFIFGKIK